MKMMIDLEVKSPPVKINYSDNILVVGSCFTEHIGGRLQELKFSVLQNPNGILFDPLSVSASLLSYVKNKQYGEQDLFYLNELWQSWDHHSKYSGLNKEEVLNNINASQNQSHNFIKKADWLIITLGSSFSYQLVDNNKYVANCHRAPGQWFNKNFTTISEIVEALSTTVSNIKIANPALKVIFTISPVRHIRDGVIENNRSKARLIEAVNQLIDSFRDTYYFPAYEIVIDVLRDYRFYDIDLVHPNYAATEFVFEKFANHYIKSESLVLMEEIKQIVTAYKHKPFNAASNAHKSFLDKNYNLAKTLMDKHSFINLNKEIVYFSSQVD